MRHSLIYNYLREPGVSMSQNAYKHPCSKHLITVGKGTHFFPNWDKKTDKKFGITPIFNKRFGRFGKNSYLCTARTRQASPRCSNVRVVLLFVGYDRWNSSCLLLSNSFWTSYRTFIGHLLGHFSSNMSICPFILADFQRVRTILFACLLIYLPF